MQSFVSPFCWSGGGGVVRRHLGEGLAPEAAVAGRPHDLPAGHVVELRPLGLGRVGPQVPGGGLLAPALHEEGAALEEEEERPGWVAGQLGVEDLPDEGGVAAGALAGVVGEEEVVAQQDDAGEELAQAGLVPVAEQQLLQSHSLHSHPVSQPHNPDRRIKYNNP